jgi:hypothetical protein
VRFPGCRCGVGFASCNGRRVGGRANREAPLGGRLRARVEPRDLRFVQVPLDGERCDIAPAFCPHRFERCGRSRCVVLERTDLRLLACETARDRVERVTRDARLRCNLRMLRPRPSEIVECRKGIFERFGTQDHSERIGRVLLVQRVHEDRKPHLRDAQVLACCVEALPNRVLPVGDLVVSRLERGESRLRAVHLRIERVKAENRVVKTVREGVVLAPQRVRAVSQGVRILGAARCGDPACDTRADRDHEQACLESGKPHEGGTLHRTAEIQAICASAPKDNFVSFLACSSPCRHPERLLPSGACDAPAGSRQRRFAP